MTELTSLPVGLDKKDQFRTGHRIGGRRRGRTKTKPPDWIYDIASIGKFLLNRFPKISVQGSRDEKQAKRWAIAINAWRYRELHQTVEARHGWSPGTVSSIIQQIKWAAAGLRLDGTSKTGKPRGRPRE